MKVKSTFPNQVDNRSVREEILFKSMALVRVSALLVFIVFATGCLDVQYKDYEFILNPDGTWRGTITYRNIISRSEDDKDASETDFQQLINDYYLGNALVEDNHQFQNIEKDLYIEDDTLIGKMTFTFHSIDSMGFYKDENSEYSSYFFYDGTFKESLMKTNGEYLGEKRDFPLIKWGGEETHFTFSTASNQNMDDAVSLVNQYREWQTKPSKE